MGLGFATPPGWRIHLTTGEGRLKWKTPELRLSLNFSQDALTAWNRLPESACLGYTTQTVLAMPPSTAVQNAPAYGGCSTGAASFSESEATVVCHCLQVTETEICDAIVAFEVASVKQLGHCTGAGQGCTACHATLREYLRRRG